MSALRLALVFAALLSARSASGQETLPYGVRHLSFTGLGTTVQGDIRTVGMGGATVGLADTFIASVDNPAGLAMTVGVGDIHYATDTVHDGHVQLFSDAPQTESIGLALGRYPWAISVGYLSRYREDATYVLPYLVAKPVELSVATNEFVLSGARVLAHNRVALGAAVILGQAVRQLDAGQLNTDSSFTSYTAGVSAGVTVQLPLRLLLGASFSSPMHYSAASSQQQQALTLPGFFQPVVVPWRASLGLGFIPNRFFRADLTVHLLTATPHTALVRSEDALVGQSVTVQPRLGLAYVFADFKEFKSTVYAGSYFELTRIATTNNRLHGTFGAEARIWLITFGGGLDFADRYRNYQLSVGADIFGLMARLKIIPRFWITPSAQLFPSPFHPSDDGLSRPLVAHWAPSPTDIDPVKVSLAIPGKLGPGLRNAELDVEHFGKDLAAKMAASNDTDAEKRVRARRAEEARLDAEGKQSEEAQRAERARLDDEERQAELHPIAEIERVEALMAQRKAGQRRRRHRQR